MRSRDTDPGFLSEQLQKHFEGLQDMLQIQHGNRTVSVGEHTYPKIPMVFPAHILTHSSNFPSSNLLINTDKDESQLDLLHQIPLENRRMPIFWTASTASLRKDNGMIYRPSMSLLGGPRTEDERYEVQVSPLNSRPPVDIGERFNQVISHVQEKPAETEEAYVRQANKSLSRVSEFYRQNRLSPSEVPIQLYTQTNERPQEWQSHGAYDPITGQYRHLG